MNTLILRSRARNRRAPSLPLFDYADKARVRSLPLPARRLVRKLGLPPATALAVACAAGFNCGDDR